MRVLQGFSLIECLVTMAVIGIIMAPMMMSLTQSVVTQKNMQYLQTRNLIINSLTNRLAVPLNNYTSLFDNLAVSTTQSGGSLTSIVKVDNANSNVFNRRSYVYVYNPSATGSNWTEGVPIDASSDSFYLDVGNTTANITDTSNNVWQRDTNFDNTNKIGGLDASFSPAAAIQTPDTNNITNTANDSIYRTYRRGADHRYNIPVANGSYYVEIHSVELDPAITATTPNRRMDIYLEAIADTDTPMGTNLSPFEASGATYEAVAFRYPITVTDGVLNIRVKKSASSGNNPNVMGITVYPKGLN
jgi:prepilin-type N-terminal cleavage/methylation domain-containing protein